MLLSREDVLSYKKAKFNNIGAFTKSMQVDELMSRELNIKYLRNEGFKRYQCKKCGAYFWSSVPRDTCTESPCGGYKFLKEQMFKREYGIKEMRDTFINFFRERGHTPIKRYPVVARWRDDVFLVNASIYDFQPHVTSGLVEPPANPLVISQPCIRMVDIDSVGKTGRHLTGFEMMAHHAFNYKDKFVYWKDETVRYAIEFLQSLGAKKKDIVLKEHPWFGGGNAGASLEVIVGGLELATLVFMNLREDSNGDVEIDGIKYSEMPLKIVDTGYGLERFVWVSRMSPTIYDAIYPDMISMLMEEAKIERGEKEDEILLKLAYHSPKIEVMGEKKFVGEFVKIAGITRDYYNRYIVPIQKIYTLVDYTRSLSFMLTDGIIPSNIQAGYLARLLIRRSLNIIKDLKIPFSLYDLVEIHVNNFRDVMDRSMLPTIKEELKLEKERYEKTLARGRELVKRMMKKKKSISVDDLILLYDSHGILPEIVQKIGKEKEMKIEVPENFHSLVAKRHEKAKKEEKKEKREYDYPSTKLLYYKDSYIRKFEAIVLGCENNEVILDQTAFYPEGGGQPSDRGKIIVDGIEYSVMDVQKYGDVVVHRINGCIEKGKKIKGFLDWDRRERLMRMHTAEHILLASARRVLGKHIWQHGTQKGVYESRFDIAHYKTVSRDEIKKIEREALRIITANLDVNAKFMDRRDAENKYGFVLYEGGIPPGKEIRVVKIDGYDVEACGGTHVKKTGEIGFLKIIKTERIQDGVTRIIYSAGLSALENVQEMEDTLIQISHLVNSDTRGAVKKIRGLMDEMKALRKEKERLIKEKIQIMAEEYVKQAKNGKLVLKVNVSREEMQEIVHLLSKKLDEVTLISMSGDIMVYSRSGKAREIATEIAKVMDGRAGGKRDFSQGKGNERKIGEGLKRAKEITGI